MIMNFFKSLIIIWAFCAASVPSLAEPSEDCIVSSISELADVIENCDDIIIRNLTVPAQSTGNRINLYLKDGAHLTFEGTTTFQHFQWFEWGETLIHFKGNNLTVEGAPGSLLDGQGARYWDGIGDNGVPKPFFIMLNVTNSIFKNINLLNCPHHCTIIQGSDRVTLEGWNIDCSDGDGNGGHNTDGFDITAGNNVVIKDSTVINQDDCVAVNQGHNMSFSGLYCNGSHGISLSVGFSNTSYEANTVQNVTYSNCTVVNSRNAIHIKTHYDGGLGEITDVTYENIRFSEIHNYGINIQQDYANGGSIGILRGNIPITNLQFRDIKGSLSSSYSSAIPVYIYCAEGACLNWTWSDVEVTGGVVPSSCNYEPDGYEC